MAISAYRGGRLKKDALRGTSLAADTSRAQEKSAFTSLHQRARASANDPAAFQKRVAGEFAQKRELGLQAIAQQRGQIGRLQGEMSEFERARATARGDIQLGEERVAGLTTALQKKFKKKGFFKKMVGAPMKAAKLGTKPGKLMKKAMKFGTSPKAWTQAALLGGKKGRRAKLKAAHLKRQLQKQGAYEDFQQFVAERGQATGKLASVRDYRNYLAQREQAARESLPGMTSSIEERQGRIGEAQEAIERTYTPLAERAKLYSGFFGGA